MKKLKKLIIVLTASAMVWGRSLTDVFAAEEYTYQVSFYAGNQGTFSGLDGIAVGSRGQAQLSLEEDRIVISGLKAGDRITFDTQQGAVSLKDEGKYYVQGVRLSGRDNDNASVDASAFTVEGDEDYVVAYGIRGEMVAYTVNYLDEDGSALAPSRTYYGNVGDKPVVAYLYMEGYMPQALSLTKTLSQNEAENVFDFTYRETTPEIIPGETVTVTTVVPGTTQVITTQVPAAAAGVTAAATGTAAGTTGTAGTGTAGTGDTGAAGTDGTAAGETGTQADGTGAGTGAQTAGAAGTEGTDTAEGEAAGNAGAAAGTEDADIGAEAGTEEIQEDETPLGQIDLDEGSEQETNTAEASAGSEALPIVAGVGIAAAALAAIGTAAVLIRRYLKR